MRFKTVRFFVKIFNLNNTQNGRQIKVLSVSAQCVFVVNLVGTKQFYHESNQSKKLEVKSESLKIPIIRQNYFSLLTFHFSLPLPFALCRLPSALCPLPFALCPLPFAVN